MSKLVAARPMLENPRIIDYVDTLFARKVSAKEKKMMWLHLKILNDASTASGIPVGFLKERALPPKAVKLQLTEDDIKEGRSVAAELKTTFWSHVWNETHRARL